MKFFKGPIESFSRNGSIRTNGARTMPPSSPHSICHESQSFANDTTRRRIGHLHRITAMLLQEQIHTPTVSDSGKKSRNTCPTAPCSYTSSQDKPSSLQKLDPWAESKECQQSDTRTDQTTMCSALEMLDNLCNRDKNPGCYDYDNDPRRRNVGELGCTPRTLNDLSLIPQEIIIDTTHHWDTPTISSRPKQQQEEEPSAPAPAPTTTVHKGQQKQKFLSKLFQRNMGKRDSQTKASKAYLDPPKPLERNDSLGQSTITWHVELQRTASIE